MPNRAELQLHVNRYRQRAVRTASQKTVADDETWGVRERASCSCEQRPQELYNFHKRTHRTLLNLKSIIILNLILYHTIRHLQHMNEPKKKTTKTKKTTHSETHRRKTTENTNPIALCGSATAECIHTEGKQKTRQHRENVLL